MTLLIGTADGVYRGSGDLASPTRVLDRGRTFQLASTAAGALAATVTGLYRSTDDADTWADLGVPETEVWTAHQGGDGRLYAGCYPAAVYVSDDDGETWDELETIQAVPHRAGWYCPGDDDEGRIRTIASHPDRPDRLFVGVEVGGLYGSHDGGETWTDHGSALEHDIHHVLVRGPEEYVVSCGRLNRAREYGPAGLFHTRDDGEQWTRLDTGEYTYVRESIVHDGTWYLCASRTDPGTWKDDDSAKARLFESTDGRNFEAVPFPGGPREIVLCWAVHNGQVVGGTGPRYWEAGRLIRRTEDAWTTVAELPAGIHSLLAV